MDADHRSRSRTGFPTTRWSLVLAAGRGSAPDSKEALSTLCQTYWFPLYSFVRRKGYRPEDAEDIVQGFFADFLAGSYLSRVERNRGRFRSYLLAAMSHHLSSERDRSRAAKRGGGHADLPFEIDFPDGERRYMAEPGTSWTPETLYDRRWALTLMDNALASVRKRYEHHAKAGLYAEIAQFLGGGEDEVSYRQVAERLGMTDGAVRIAVHRLRRRFRESLCEEIAHTVAEEAAIESEMRHFFAALCC